MRRLAALPACLALLLALFMAPYQHVHLATGHEDHNDSAVVHVHFLPVAPSASQDSGPSFDHSDRDHFSRSLDTFTTIPQAALSLPFRPESPARLFIDAESCVGIEIVDVCSHDPPCLDASIPRAPPS
jgi:hypothetical protein